MSLLWYAYTVHYNQKLSIKKTMFSCRKLFYQILSNRANTWLLDKLKVLSYFYAHLFKKDGIYTTTDFYVTYPYMKKMKQPLNLGERLFL